MGVRVKTGARTGDMPVPHRRARHPAEETMDSETDGQEEGEDDDTDDDAAGALAGVG